MMILIQPKAISYVFEGVRVFNSLCPAYSKKTGEKASIAQKFLSFIKTIGEDLSLFQYEPQEWLRSIDKVLIKKWDLDEERISQLVSERSARQEKQRF